MRRPNRLLDFAPLHDATLVALVAEVHGFEEHRDLSRALAQRLGCANPDGDPMWVPGTYAVELRRALVPL